MLPMWQRCLKKQLCQNKYVKIRQMKTLNLIKNRAISVVNYINKRGDNIMNIIKECDWQLGVLENCQTISENILERKGRNNFRWI